MFSAGNRRAPAPALRSGAPGYRILAVGGTVGDAAASLAPDRPQGTVHALVEPLVQGPADHLGERLGQLQEGAREDPVPDLPGAPEHDLDRRPVPLEGVPEDEALERLRIPALTASLGGRPLDEGLPHLHALLPQAGHGPVLADGLREGLERRLGQEAEPPRPEPPDDRVRSGAVPHRGPSDLPAWRRRGLLDEALSEGASVSGFRQLRLDRTRRRLPLRMLPADREHQLAQVVAVGEGMAGQAGAL